MKMDQVAGSKDDEFYSPLYAVKPIFKYLNKGTTIWCPFDTADSYFVRYGKKLGFKVIKEEFYEREKIHNYYMVYDPDSKE